ncbi:MAG: single-stranded DNA-binding protein [Cryobacterium sp.]|nr:single-stranded DNA-binding protein [Cryobacterium sp.]
MKDNLTVSGFVATTPRHLTTAEGVSITSFRLASNRRKFDRDKKTWIDAGTNWYSVSTYRDLASNVIGSVRKGDRVLVIGRLRMSEWGDGDRRGVNIDLDADALGHDLRWGTTSFSRTIRSESVESEDPGDPADESDETEGAEADSGTPLDVAAPF